MCRTSKHTQMKTLATTLLLTLACMTSFAIGDDGNDRETERTEMNVELRKQLNRYMIAPIFTEDANKSGRVDVSFVINTEGRIQVLSIESDNAYLAEHVKRKLDKVKLKENPNGFWKTTKVSFQFERES